MSCTAVGHRRRLTESAAIDSRRGLWYMNPVRGIKRSVVVRQPPEAVWAWLASIHNWDVLADAFSWPRSGYRHVLREGGKPAALALDKEIALLGAGNRTVWIWKVAEWITGRKLTLVARTNHFLSGYHMQWAFEIEPDDDGGSKIQFGFYFLMHNAAFEVLTFVPPMSLIYGRKAGRIVAAIKRAFA